MKNILILTLILLVGTLFSCSDDKFGNSILIDDTITTPHKSIIAGSTEHVHYELIHDSISSIGKENQSSNRASKNYDLNADGKDDVTLTTMGGGGTNGWAVTSYFMPLDSNEVVITSCNFTDLKSKDAPLGIEEDIVIDDTQNFKNYPYNYGEGFEISFDGSSSKMNCWGNDVYQYIGVKITNTTIPEYAWIKIAVNTTPNKTTTYIESFGSRQ